MSTQKTGALGEDLALAEYQRRGYRLLGRNFLIRQGEVDLILTKDALLVFCEVKARGPGALDTPAAWVDGRKQRRIIMAAQVWLKQHGYNEPFMRFDVAEVLLGPGGRSEGAVVNIIENAFGA